MKRIKLFEDFDLPFTEKEIDEIFKSYFYDIPKLTFEVKTSPIKRVNDPVLIGDDLHFDVNEVVLVEVTPEVDFSLSRDQILRMQSIKEIHQDLFDGVIDILEKRGCLIDISIKSKSFLFYIYI